jgi:DNA polymerase III subunit delta'
VAQAPFEIPVTLHRHWGHDSLLSALARARVKDSLPAALLIHGSRGVGKQHLALWLSRLLLCDSPESSGPCEKCGSCGLALKLIHPDLHWYFPLPRPKEASTPEKLAQALEAARAEALEEIRKYPFRPVQVGEARSVYLAAARHLRRQAQRRPSRGDRQVFIIGDAESLAPQESSSEAANALLKLLEEPPSGTSLILTSSEPGRLLPTIRSRTAQLHLPPLSLAEVKDFLMQVAGIPEDEARRVAAASQGAIGRALGFLGDEGGPGPFAKTRSTAMDLLWASLAPDPGPAFQAAAGFKATGARGLQELLNFLEECLRDLAVEASGGRGAAWSPEERKAVEALLARTPVHPTSLATALGSVAEARRMAAGNVNPQLLVFGLLHDLRRALLNSRCPEPRPPSRPMP